jgi:ABC-type amino acid transport substrate-binding protein
MSRIIFIIISTCILLSCSSKNERTVIIGYNGEYSSSFEYDMTKKIVLHYLGRNSLKCSFKSMDKKDLLKNLQSGKIDIAIDDFETYPSAALNSFNSSADLYSGAVYFIMNAEESRIFKYPDSIYSLKTGIVFESESYDFLKKIPGSKQFYYKDIGNLLKDFRERKLDIAILDRKEFYRNLLTLPDTYLFFLEDGNCYGRILFAKKSGRDLFNAFLYKRKSRQHDWADILGKFQVVPIF